jgi:uncharacterized damage-inducible protein DinB
MMLEGEETAVTGLMLEAFRHNSWATEELLRACRGLSKEQLATPATGTFGGILATLNHLVLAEGGYLRSLTGSAPAWTADSDEETTLDQLEAWVEELEGRWERFLSEPVDADRIVVVDQGVREVRAGVIVAQVLHHGNAHREQVCAILTSFGIEPPDVQPWEYAWATKRIWDRKG